MLEEGTLEFDRGAAALAAGVHGREQAEAGFRHQAQHRVEILRVAAVTDDAAAVDVRFVEAERVTVERGVRAHHTLVHLLRRFRLENARLAQCAVLQVREHEARHVRDGRSERASRACGMNEFEAVRLERACFERVAAGHARRQRLGQRLAEGAALHAERLEDVLRDVVVEGLARHGLDDVPGQRRGPVRVRRAGAIAEVSRGRPHACRLVGRQPFAERQQVFGLAREQVADAAVLEAGRVRHDVAQLHRLGEGRRRP